ncbi:unnamed protein product [Bursaphelenchus okinawaensis]|uniref:Uncharacterized protein n=1 Tax=Bursaphelenchus okinawaensis TaxID=465554 RepID=A0A811LIE0_9BILA|nr:unnamed protein product [Bursaphelenchus okinawaensis]CAG9123799.1 unnamed protein product [Bursaphelenchus okinawaensis]
MTSPKTGSADDIIMIVFILFLPPLAVWWKDRMNGNGCSAHVCINLILLLLFVFPSVIHAIWYCFCRD